MWPEQASERIFEVMPTFRWMSRGLHALSRALQARRILPDVVLLNLGYRRVSGIVMKATDAVVGWREFQGLW